MAEDPLSDKGQSNCVSRRSVLAGFGAALGVVGCARISANPGIESRVMELTMVRRIKFSVPNYAHRLAWSHDGHRLALGGVLDARLSVWDVNTGSRLPAPGDQTGGTHALAYSPDGRHLAVARAPVAARNRGQERYTVSLWDARTVGLVGNLVEPDQAEIPMIEARFVTFSPDGRYLAVVYGKQVALYALDAGGNARRVLVTDLRALSCTFRPDGGALVCQEIGWNPRAVLLRVPDGVVLDAFEGPLATAMTLSSDGSLLARAGGERVAITNTSGPRTARTLLIDEKAAIIRLSFSTDGKWLAAMDYKRVDIWETQTWSHGATLIAQAEHGDLFQEAAFSPKGTHLAVAGGNLATIWQVRNR
jgi:WD40 repeat protein